MTSPSVWGKHYWYVFHISALAYPEHPSDMEKAVYKSFYTNFGEILPCKKCSQNYKDHLEELPIDNNVMASNQTLFAWTVEVHNIVNKYANKPVWNTEYAEAYYKSGSYDVTVHSPSKTPVISESNQWKGLYMSLVVLNIVVILFLIFKISK